MIILALAPPGADDVPERFFDLTYLQIVSVLYAVVRISEAHDYFYRCKDKEIFSSG
jgi:hypothetical protein